MQSCRNYDPKSVIPAHYFLNGLTTDISGLESADGWVNDQEKAIWNRSGDGFFFRGMFIRRNRTEGPLPQFLL